MGAPRGAVTALHDLIEIAVAIAGADIGAVLLFAEPEPSVVATDEAADDLVQSDAMMQLVRRDELLTIDALVDDQSNATQDLVELGIEAVAIVPLASSDGDAVGALCLLAKGRRAWSSAVRSALAAVGRQIEMCFDRHEEQYHLRDLSLRLAASEAAVKERSEQLARSNRDLERFAFFAAHELQSPLRAVNAFATVLRDLAAAPAEADPEMLDRAAARVDQEAAHMTAQVEGLLSLATLSDSEMSADAVALGEVMDIVIDRLAPLVEEAGGQILVDDLPMVTGHAPSLEIVFMNIVSNAVRYRDPARPLRIEITARDRDGAIAVAVADNGVGIDADDLERVFQAFQRGHGDVVGAGIGLTLTRRLVEATEGSISVESVAGVGSTFTVVLPRG